ncbi:MAG: LysM peptidoglycan-binding domain-containing protein [Dysgonomonas sp.]|nr:LysM peptidoglycan-binding domain-containing protein [Dysgonomonas sp.]
MNFKYIRLVTLFCCCLSLTISFDVLATENAISELLVLQSAQERSHKVSTGETVYSIAKSYNVTVVDIYDANPSAVNGIRVGDMLRIPSQNQIAASNRRYSNATYTVKSKETLYSIAKNNGTTVDEIINLNPELKSKPLSDGQVLDMPGSKNNTTNTPVVRTSPPQNSEFRTHQVEAKETIYGIARQYGVTPEALVDFNPSLKNGLKIGSSVVIPTLQATSANQVNQKNLLQDVSAISIGIVLPFVNKSDGQSARFVEYYEGFLLALQEMKEKGLSANVYAFDMGSTTGTDKLKSLLDTYEMKYLDLIIGGVSNEQIATISAFAKKQGIKYVVPFPTKANEVYNNPQVFQVNAPSTTLYPNVANTFINLFPNVNLIYIKESGSEGDRADFIKELNLQLPKAGIIPNSVVANQSLSSTLSSALQSGRKNIIIPTSSSTKVLQSILTSLNSISQERTDLDISLFGHTSWQTYSQYSADFNKYDTYIYSPFYMDDNDSKSRRFLSDYQRWYNNKSLINTHPRYGALGYDTGISFLTALWRNGKNFASNPNSMNTSSLQTPFLFKQVNSTGGYMNNGFYLIHYREDGSIVKTEYGR